MKQTIFIHPAYTPQRAIGNVKSTLARLRSQCKVYPTYSCRGLMLIGEPSLFTDKFLFGLRPYIDVLWMELVNEDAARHSAE